MAEILFWSLFLAAALAVLLKSAEVFVAKSALLALNLGVSDALIGITLVALGTSLPELASGLFSVAEGADEFVVGTVAGSNVANLCLVLGAAALAYNRFKVSGDILRRDVTVMVLATLLLSLASFNGVIARWEGLALFSLYPAYLLIVAGAYRSGPSRERVGKIKFWTIPALFVSGAGIYLGAKYTVSGVIRLTTLLGLGDTSVLALTVVAVGSSLPELVVSLTAAKRGHFDMCLGNVVGSNICNSLLVAGGPALLTPLAVSPMVTGAGLPFMLTATLLMTMLALRRSFGRAAGAILVLVFTAFLASLTLVGGATV